jgi:hypothetical protein
VQIFVLLAYNAPSTTAAAQKKNNLLIARGLHYSAWVGGREICEPADQRASTEGRKTNTVHSRNGNNAAAAAERKTRGTQREAAENQKSEFTAAAGGVGAVAVCA